MSGAKLSLLLAVLAVRAEASGVEAASFLDIPVGGRPAALGGAYSALAADAYAPVWNPAGLGLLPGRQLAAMHLSYLESVGYEFISYVHPLRRGGGLGGSVQLLRPEPMALRDASGAEIGSFSSYYGAYSIAYGRRAGKALSFGATVKWIDARIGDASAGAAAGDAGALYRISARVQVAAAIANVGSRIRFLHARDELPRSYRVGVLLNPTAGVRLAADGFYDRGGLPAGRLGAEWSPFSFVFLRAGYRTDPTRELSGLSGVTAGLGLNLYGQSFDYAWVPLGRLGQTQYFSILFSFGSGGQKR